MKRIAKPGRVYLRKVRGLLPCSHRKKRELMGPFTESVEAFLSDHPKASFSDIQLRFGSPQNVAATCLESMEISLLLRSLHIRRRVLFAVVAVCMAVLVTWAGMLLHALNVVNRNFPGRTTEQIIIIDRQEFTSPEDMPEVEANH